MSRTLVTLRSADVTDATFLVELWALALRRADHADQVADLESVITACAEAPGDRLLVAEYDGARAGAVLLRLTTLTPLNLEPAVAVLAPHVAPGFRRHGVGRSLVEAGVAFAEENGVTHLSTAVASGARDSNRFMARLGLGAHAMVRVSPVTTVRAKLSAQRPALTPASSGARQATRVLAARRSMRRSQSSAS